MLICETCKREIPAPKLACANCLNKRYRAELQARGIVAPRLKEEQIEINDQPEDLPLSA